MSGFDDPGFYGDRWAAVYDDRHEQVDPGPAVEFLAGLARDGRVLELAVGTGRVALPLAARGIRVEGIDASAAMMERLRAKPGGESIPVTLGDMAQVPVSGRFRLVYLVFNTLFGLLSQERQAECFANVVRVLSALHTGDMPVRLHHIVVDAHDLPGLARFWTQALGWKVLSERENEIVIGSDENAPVGMCFMPVADPKMVKNRVHLDLTSSVADRDQEIGRLLALGARRVDIGQTGAESWIVLADPEGNEFCVVRPKETLIR